MRGLADDPPHHLYLSPIDSEELRAQPRRPDRLPRCERRSSSWKRAVPTHPTEIRRRLVLTLLGLGRLGCQFEQSTAIASAAQISRMRVSAKRPIRSTSTATATLSTESRLTAERLGTGSSPGSRTTSLGSPRTVVVHGATNARRSLGIATSGDKTTTGRRPTSGSSHHHTSPRPGSELTTLRRLAETTQDPPTRPARRLRARRRRCSSRRPRRGGDGSTPAGGVATRSSSSTAATSTLSVGSRTKPAPTSLLERSAGSP